MASLSASDLKQLTSIVDKGHALEKLWGSHPAARELNELKKQIANLENTAESAELKRLAFHDRNLTESMTAAHLSTILVPFERLRGRAVREDEFLVTSTDTKTRATAPMTIIADNIRSAFNIGAIFRTTEAFGAEAIVLTGYSSTPDDAATQKTSLGAEGAIRWSHATKVLDVIANLKESGHSIVALETSERAETLGDFKWPERTALVLGNERFGIDHELLAHADHVLKIPLYGQKNSVNVGIALGIALNDWRQQRAQKAQKRAYSPIGQFSASTRNRYEARRQGTENQSNEIGVIELKRNHGFEQALEDLAGFERVWLVYEFDRNPNWKPKVRPPRGPGTKRGVFATRSPHRPNPIGLSCVELVKVEGLRLFVRGFDLLDQTPILDIKPYLAKADSFPLARAGWTENLDDEAYDVVFSVKAMRQLSWLHEKGASQMRDFFRAQLEYAPLDTDRKRVWSDAGSFLLAYRTWRARFETQIETKQIFVHEIASGYTEEELASLDDPYQDKERHRAFVVENFD